MADIKTTTDITNIQEAGFNEFLAEDSLVTTSLQTEGGESRQIKSQYLSGGTFNQSKINLGKNLIFIDSSQGRIVVNDGANPVVVMGRLP